tara:strand:- start:327 stop:1211 length:885 start_codon:yes stop_codon:yes gene_type:complete
MKKYLILILIIFYVSPAYSISSYIAKYDLYVLTNLGTIKVGSAEYELVAANNAYVFSSNAKTDKLWSALYDYSINETSIGLIEGNKIIGDYYKVTENQGDLISDEYEINIYPEDGYASLNSEIISNGFTKSHLEELSDSELILKAINSGNYKKIKFAGNQANDNNIPSYEKELVNKDELIGLLLEPSLDISSVDIVDALSIYLHISNDIQKNPNKKVFIYQVVDKKGLSQREFFIDGFETINVGNNEVKTIRVKCPELRLSFNVSKDHDFIPVLIDKKNGKTNFQLTLTSYINI